MENKNTRVCPWWLGYLFITPWRKYQHNPDTILGPYINKGMNVLDYGCAMGYFSLPMAQMTGEKGNVYCVDIQTKMLAKLQKRAQKAGVGQIIKPLLVGKDYKPSEMQSTIDFALIFAVVHEVPDQAELFNDLYRVVKPGGRVLFAEPKGHVSTNDFNKSILLAQSAGFRISGEKPLPKGLSVFLLK